MFKVVIVNGSGGSGKDTFVEYCQAYLEKNKSIMTYNISTIDLVRKAARILGWSDIKDEHSRKFLSDLKDIWSEYNSGPFFYVLDFISERKQLHNNENFVVFVHSREPEEIERFKMFFGNYCITLLIDRGKIIKSNHADANVENYSYDAIIENKKDLNNLKNSAEQFCNNLSI